VTRKLLLDVNVLIALSWPVMFIMSRPTSASEPSKPGHLVEVWT